MNLRSRIEKLEQVDAPTAPRAGLAQRMRERAGCRNANAAPATPIRGSLAERMQQRAAGSTADDLV